jgi:predicted nucleic acid binding AN1-type Zn finger protein
MNMASKCSFINPNPNSDKVRCTKKRLLGMDCDYCHEQFCGEHRIPETHFCSDMVVHLLEQKDKDTENINDKKCVKGKL